ncbi:MAG: SAM-dependent methyltransferase, partial [Planctomycetaceae bacterium]
MALLHLMAPLIGMAEAGRLPDTLVRAGIRGLLRGRLDELQTLSPASQMDSFRSFLGEACSGPIAMLPEKANEQHYEVPEAFFGA